MGEATTAIIYGAIGSVIAFIIVAAASRTRLAMSLLGASYRLAHSLRSAGLIKFHFSRDDYEFTLPTFLRQARHSIGVVSISLRLTHEEGDLVELFRTRLAQDPSFRVRLSLLAPDSVAAHCAAPSLGVTQDQLASEIKGMLRDLTALKSSLTPSQAQRLEVLVHESFPMGSAILMDATAEAGLIQVETKLHRAPRVESFGFIISGPSPFYERHFRAWTGVFDESRPPTQAEIDVG
jgi:hypothetical protein